MKSITTKLLTVIGGLTFCILALILYFSYSLANRQTNEVIKQQAELALKFDLAIRGYIGGAIRPIMYELIDKDEFIVEAMSTSYVARSIFEELRKEFPEYILKFSSDNPRNPINQADPEELEVIERFNNNPDLDRWEGIITINGKQYMAKFNARRMRQSCLYCHGDPKDAPASMLEKYGSVAGFNRELGKVIGMDTVAIPVHKITEQLWNALKSTIPVFVFGLLLFFCAVIIIIKLLVINRLTVISKHFRSTAQETDYSQINPIDIQADIQGKDEIVDLAIAYNTLTGKLKDFYLSLDQKVQKRTERLKKMNDKLKQEINEKNRAEKALRESQDRFKALHNASFGGIVIHDKGIIIDCNQGLSEMTGYSADELVGMDGLLLIAPKSRSLVKENIFSKWEKNYEATGLRKNGEEYPIQLEARNVPYKGKQVRITELRDLSEKKQAEKEHEKLQALLIQAQKMESIGRLAGGVAHDFNNMLSVILGNAEILSQNLEPSHGSIENLKEIRKAVEKSKSLTRQLLVFAREQAVSPKIVDLNQAIEGMLKMVERLIGENIELLWQPDMDLWPVKIDPSQVDQILANLCVNARDAIKGAGKIVIKTANVHLGSAHCRIYPGHTPGDYLMITVSDTGQGMEKEVLDNLFEPFFTTKGVDEGTVLAWQPYMVLSNRIKGSFVSAVNWGTAQHLKYICQDIQGKMKIKKIIVFKTTVFKTTFKKELKPYCWLKMKRRF